MRTMSAASFESATDAPEPCIVIYVNKPKYYYQVKFVNNGIKECYKVPNVNEIDAFKSDYRRVFGHDAKGVYVYETGKIYRSISECAKAIGVYPGTLSNHIHGRLKHVKGYHVYLL